MEFLLALAIVAAVAAFVTVPLRRQPDAEVPDGTEAERAELEARKEVVYREIRDAESDHASGKLTDKDFALLDRELRGEAIGILRRLDRLDKRPG